MNLIDYFSIHIVPLAYQGKGALHPCETGRLTERVSCIREYDVNIFFYRKNGTTVAVDAGYKNHPKFWEDVDKIDVDPTDIPAVFLTHVDPDHGGGLDKNCINKFPNAGVYLGRLEENYLTDTWCRKKVGFLKMKNPIKIRDGYTLLEDRETVIVDEIKIQTLYTPGHTLGHVSYLIDDEYLFTGDSIALNKDGGYCFFDFFNIDSGLNVKSLQMLHDDLTASEAVRYVFTAHNGFSDDFEKAFSHIDRIPDIKKKGFVFDETAPFNCFTK